MANSSSQRRSDRADAIRRASIPVFAAQGFRRTSMADLAEAAGVSRPALYQYFDNRADIFRAAFDLLLNDATDAALAALYANASVAERLDGYLQRAHGDGYAAMSATPHGDELMEDRHQFAEDVAIAATGRAHEGLRVFLGATATNETEPLEPVTDLLILAPGGLKRDTPPPTVYRARLTALARAAAALAAVPSPSR